MVIRENNASVILIIITLTVNILQIKEGLMLQSEGVDNKDLQLKGRGKEKLDVLQEKKLLLKRDLKMQQEKLHLKKLKKQRRREKKKKQKLKKKNQMILNLKMRKKMKENLMAGLVKLLKQFRKDLKNPLKIDFYFAIKY